MDIVIFFSKYLILLFIGLLVFSSFITILQENEKINVNLKNPSLLIIVLFHLLCSTILIAKNDFLTNFDTLIFCSIVLVFILLTKSVLHFIYNDSDFLITNIMLFMLDLSFLFLYRLDENNAIRQLVFATGAVVMSTIIPFLFNVYLKGIKRFKHFDYVFIVLIFIFLLLPTLYGTETNGSTNWVYFDVLGGFSFQPSEIVKLIFIFYLASAFSRAQNIKTLVVPTIVSFFAILILASQNDFGGCLMFFVIFMTLLYITTSSELLLLLGLTAISFVSVLAYNFVYHVKVRVDVFLDPFKYPYDQGLQILQSLFAIGTKAPFGSGLTKGYPKYVPVVDSDFIFAGISEEFGAVFGLLLIVLIFIFFMRGLKIAKESNRKNLILIAIGISVCICFQAFLIIAGNTKLAPLTGVTLPFISYGGTSIFMSITMVMILLRIDLINLVNEEEYRPFKFIRRNVNRVSVVYFLIYCVLFVYLFRYTFYQSDDIVSSSYNPRVSIVETKNVRGDIYDKDMTALTQTSVDENNNQSRNYPFGKIFAHTVGSVYSGKTGLELSYHFRLQDPKNELLQMTKSLFFDDNIYGDSIITTLDEDLQEVCYNQLKGKKGAIIVSEAKTGKILAMNSYNDFSPNTYGENFDSLSSDEENTPLINRATQGLYPPASTFKIISSLDIMRNIENYKDYTYLCTGSVTINGETITCNDGAVHGEVNLEKAFTVSCNCFFSSLIESMDTQDLIDTAEAFNYNSKFHFDLPTSNSIFPMEKDAETDEIMQTAIGQGNTLATPLQLNMMAQAVANDGVMLKPYMVSEIINSNKKTVSTNKPETISTVMTKDEATEIAELMKGVVSSGTGRSAQPNNTTLAGKTGTAEVTGEKSHGIFVGFAPADDPEIVITVLLENSGGSKSTLPLVKNIVEYYFNNK